MDRRSFLKTVAGLGAMSALNPTIIETAIASTRKNTARIAFVKSTDRIAAVNHAIDLLGMSSVKGKDVFIKPNFNSADATPGSTHVDTLATIVRKLQKMGAGPLTVGDRSGMGKTRQVMETKGAFQLAKELGAQIIVFDELPKDSWSPLKLSESHWQKGFAIPAPVKNASAIVQTCCLKTHQYGGHFTLSLKNSVGLAARYLPGDSYDYMRELHGSPNQRRMIAEINAAYKPDLIVLDGIEAFTDGGPDKGKKVASQIILAGTDRVAIDAVGVALLRYYGTTPQVSQGKIFEQEQIARAAELNLGVTGPDQIELITDDPASAEYAKIVYEQLAS